MEHTIRYMKNGLENNDRICSICKRETPLQFWEKHHLTPKVKSGRNKGTIWVCSPCGHQVHKLFTIKELQYQYNTIESLLLDERIQKWIRWIRKKPGAFYVCMKNKKKKL